MLATIEEAWLSKKIILFTALPDITQLEILAEPITKNFVPKVNLIGMKLVTLLARPLIMTSLISKICQFNF